MFVRGPLKDIVQVGIYVHHHVPLCSPCSQGHMIGMSVRSMRASGVSAKMSHEQTLGKEV